MIAKVKIPIWLYISKIGPFKVEIGVKWAFKTVSLCAFGKHGNCIMGKATDLQESTNIHVGNWEFVWKLLIGRKSIVIVQIFKPRNAKIWPREQSESCWCGEVKLTNDVSPVFLLFASHLNWISFAFARSGWFWFRWDATSLCRLSPRPATTTLRWAEDVINLSYELQLLTFDTTWIKRKQLQISA